MDKRYQVFISSTFADLQSERQLVMQTLLKMNCIPAGMELFPAADEEQFDFIKKIIDDCDYYLLIIAARYGTLAPDGVSYTEKEYEYAIEKGKKVIALIHKNPGSLPIDSSDKNSTLEAKLQVFRKKVSKGRLVEFWEDGNELSGKVAISLLYAIKMYPAVGWVRGDAIANEEILVENRELRNENIQLKEQLYTIAEEAGEWRIEGLVDFEMPINVDGFLVGCDNNIIRKGTEKKKHTYMCTWLQLFLSIAKYLRSEPDEYYVKSCLEEYITKEIDKNNFIFCLSNDGFEKIGLQLEAYSLIRIKQGVTHTIKYSANSDKEIPVSQSITQWELTNKGKRLMFEHFAIKS